MTENDFNSGMDRLRHALQVQGVDTVLEDAYWTATRGWARDVWRDVVDRAIQTSRFPRVLPTPAQLDELRRAYAPPVAPSRRVWRRRSPAEEAECVEERFRTVPQCVQPCEARRLYVERTAGLQLSKEQRDTVWQQCGGETVTRDGLTWSGVAKAKEVPSV